MRFRTPLITSFVLLIVFILLLLGQQTLISQLVLSICFGLVLIFQLILLIFDHEFSGSHTFLTATLFLSLGYLVLNILGRPTLTTFFLGGMFILLYLLDILIILVYNWRQYKMFDRMIVAMQDKDGNPQPPKAPPVVPVEQLVDEPPHVRLHNEDDGEWVEIKMKKPARKAAKKKTTKARRKRSTKVKK